MVIAESLAVGIVTIAVLAPGGYLLRVAWRRGGLPKKLAVATLVAASGLVAWLFFMPRAPGTTVADRVSQFAGAWGILFMAVGLVVIVCAAFPRRRPRKPPDAER